jgi:putative nucleotidyltransferase with HDIG domain
MKGMKASPIRLWRASWRSSIPLLLFTAALGALLYSVYQPYGAVVEQDLVVGRPSPALFRSPIDLEIIDQLATERDRQAARAQVGTIYSTDLQVQRLVLDAIATSTLPVSVQVLMISAYQQPEGVREEQLAALIDEALAATEPDRQHEVRLLLERLLLPTSLPDVRLTEAARQAAASEVRPVMTRLQAGQTIVREGDLLTSEHLRILEAVGLFDPRAEAASRGWWVLIGCGLLALLVSLPLWYARRQLVNLSRRQLYFLAALSLLLLAAQRLALLADPHFLFIYALSLLLALLLNESVALAWGVWLSVTVTLLTPAEPLTTLVTLLVATVIAILFARAYRSRSSALLAGVLGGTAAAGALFILHLVEGGQGYAQPFSLWPLTTSALWLIGGGLLAGILALGLLPIAEGAVGFLTEFRLIELTNPSQPLLQRLLLEAPGSYQHSMIIANLVDQAVANIGGNALLARVGALYHDVGKLKRPQFFVENQLSGENPHDRLNPHLSYLIITSHVRDGLELLREYKLPQELEPFVLEHHGTTVLTYFYKRALEDSAKLDELNFRYPGPRPRSKETAILMLADTVESASRTLTEPSQGSIRAMIDRLIEQRLADGQLAESPLNFHDLEVIANTFERMLTAILHRRIRYPSAEEIQGLKRGGDSRRNQVLPASR